MHSFENLNGKMECSNTVNFDNSYPDNSDLRLIRVYLRPLFRDDQSNIIRLIRISHYSYNFSVPSDANQADLTVLLSNSGSIL